MPPSRRRPWRRWRVTALLIVLGLAGLYWYRGFLINPADVQLFGAAPADMLGGFFAEAGSGDLNGDGIDELILSADQFGRGVGGSVYIYRGGRTLGSTEDLASSAPDLTIAGPPGHRFFGQGFRVADLDGDGFGDLFVGSQRNAIDRDDLPWGALYIFRGGPDFFGRPARDADSAEHAILGSSTDSNYPIDVAFATGDVNADGRADLIIGSNGASRPGELTFSAGRVLILFGREDWPERLTLSRSTVDVEILGRPAEKEENRAPSRLGRAVAIGDLNGDGVDDAIASAWWGGADMRGRVFIFFGRDDWPETIDLHQSSADVTIENGPEGGQMGHSLAVGDFNGDAIDDLAFSSFEASTLGREKNGAAFILFGSADLPSTVDLESSPGFTTIHGPADSRRLGYLVRSGGADASGAQDLLLTGVDSGGLDSSDHGFGALLQGQNKWPDVIDLEEVDPAWSFRGGFRHNFLGVGAYMADFNGDGIQDLVIADSGFSLFRRPRCGLVYVFYGPFL